MSAESVELVNVDQETQALAERAPMLIESAKSFLCNSRDAFLEAAERLRNVKRLHKSLEEKRVSVTGPINEALRTLNAWFRLPLDHLTSAENIYKQKMGEFESAEQQRERAENAKREAEAREQREELERRAAAAAAKGNTEKAQALVQKAAEVIPERADIIPPKAKGMGFGEAWDFTITDASLLPREYLTPDLAKIRLMVKALKNKEHAERQIPGITVTSRAAVSVRV
jgi:tetratricopeptide (TPR) repeat protein